MMSTRQDAGPPDPQFTITRWFMAPRRRVFQAWSQSCELAHWLVPSSHSIHFERCECRAAGFYRGRISTPDGSGYWVQGTVRTLLPPVGLVFTAARERSNGRVERRGARIVTLAEAGRQTQLTLQIPLAAVLKTRGATARAWEQRFDRLAHYLETVA